MSAASKLDLVYFPRNDGLLFWPSPRADDDGRERLIFEDLESLLDLFIRQIN